MPFVTRAARTKKSAQACFHGCTKIFIVWKWAFVRVCIVALCLKWREVWNTARPSRCGGVPIISQGTNPLETGVYNPTEIQYLVTWTRNGCSFDRSMMPMTSSKSSTALRSAIEANHSRDDLSLSLSLFQRTIFLTIISFDSSPGLSIVRKDVAKSSVDARRLIRIVGRKFFESRSLKGGH